MSTHAVKTVTEPEYGNGVVVVAVVSDADVVPAVVVNVGHFLFFSGKLPVSVVSTELLSMLTYRNEFSEEDWIACIYLLWKQKGWMAAMDSFDYVFELEERK